uniref:Uncharacterized protein n=1 Tax=Timema tahoe TaxID=61484 RepID=A0A7R9IRE5_9NEOP|nr:unnamed protein product [Timema tahoe]
MGEGETQVVGWGRDENGNEVTPKLRMAQIPIVTQEECLLSLNGSINIDDTSRLQIELVHVMATVEVASFFPSQMVQDRENAGISEA